MQKEVRKILADQLDRALVLDHGLFTANYTPPLKRINEFASLPQAVKAVGECLRGLDIKPDERALRQSLTETLILNPNVDVSVSGRLIIKPEYKGFLLESLVKTLIGNTPGLFPKDFERVAASLSDGRLFEDGAGFPVERILTPIARIPGRETGDAQDGYWAADRAQRPDMFPERKYWWQAEHNLVTRVLQEHAAPAGRGENLEVGAGWGDFYSLALKNFRDNMVCVEWNPNYIREFRQRFPQAQVRQGNIYQLGFPDASFSNVVGLTPFSSLQYLDHAVAELARVLKPGGKFISFQDLIPNDDETVQQLLKRGLVPDPTHVLFFRSERDRGQAAESLSHVWNEFGGHAWKEYKKVLHGNAAVQNLYEYHEQWLASELKYRGLKVSSQKDEVETYIGPREERHKSFCQHCSMDHNRDVGMFAYGNPRGPFIEPHPPNFSIPYRLLGDDIVERITVWTTVAEKPKTR
jgi:SAM-dependent methyltransferase